MLNEKLQAHYTAVAQEEIPDARKRILEPLIAYVSEKIQCGDAITKIARVIRGELIEAMDSEYFYLARVKGLTKLQAYIRHLLKNSLVPLMPVLVDIFLLVLTGSFFVELGFGIHGVAELFYDSLIQLYPDIGFLYIDIDVNVTVIITAFYMFTGMVLSLIADVTHYLIDPRIRIQDK